jgi:hypothetical protein
MDHGSHNGGGGRGSKSSDNWGGCIDNAFYYLRSSKDGLGYWGRGKYLWGNYTGDGCWGNYLGSNHTWGNYLGESLGENLGSQQRLISKSGDSGEGSGESSGDSGCGDRDRCGKGSGNGSGNWGGKRCGYCGDNGINETILI